VAGYALNLFAGLIVFNLFGESMISSTSLITSNVAFVKKVVFPLEVLGVTAVSAATYHAAIGMLVLCLFELVTLHRIPLTIVCLPIVVGPLIMGCIALSWIISAAGVYMRDIQQLMPVVVSMLMFVSAVFYPLNGLPDGIKDMLMLNPLAVMISRTRDIAIDGAWPSFKFLLSSYTLGFTACEVSYRIFKKASRGFADVL